AALEAGAHVYLEKPVTESLADLVSLQTLAASRQRVLYPGYSTLGHPAVQKAKNIIATGAVGDLISMHCNFNVAPPVGTIPYGWQSRALGLLPERRNPAKRDRSPAKPARGCARQCGGS
ncbi:MAG: Gfo/Idh/MocA family oxidoreductase, partial [Burkholderiales bacterium]|nr:Gfo/Idh/MocA family oxidoreductase [Burkholderiales bacterium]